MNIHPLTVLEESHHDLSFDVLVLGGGLEVFDRLLHVLSKCVKVSERADQGEVNRARMDGRMDGL